jgi:signal transduction histidine kinase
MKYEPSFYLEGITHKVGTCLRYEMEYLGADTVTCFIGHEHSPGDLRLIYYKGLLYPETLYGVLSRRTLRQYLNSMGGSTGARLERYVQNSVEMAVPVEFRRTPYREGYKASLQRLWHFGGCPSAMLFFNFRKEVPEGFENETQVQKVMVEVSDFLLPLLDDFWKQPMPEQFTGLMRAAESIGSRVFFEVRDFESMSRASRNDAFADLMKTTVKADDALRKLNPWWHLWVPMSSATKPSDTNLVKIAASANYPQKGSLSEIVVGEFNTVESWVYWRDAALRFSPQCLRKKKSRFMSLLSTSHLPEHKALLSLPFTSGDKVFAVATMGFCEVESGQFGETTAAMNRVIRSLWFNSRSICRAWSQANERRQAKSARLIMDSFSETLLVDDKEVDDSGILADLFRVNLEAAKCNLWEWRDGKFRLLSKYRDSRSERPPRDDGWTHWVMRHNTPVLFMKEGSEEDEEFMVRVFRSNMERNEWTEVSTEELASMPGIRSSGWEPGCLTQLALPLDLSFGGEREPELGTVWLHFHSLNAPEHVDIDLALRFAEDIARMVAARRRHARKIAEAKIDEFERTLTHLRHETLKLIPQMIRNALIESKTISLRENAIRDIFDATELLDVALVLYSTLGNAQLPSLQPCEVYESVRRTVQLTRLSRHGSQPEVVYVSIDEHETPCTVQIDRRLLSGIILNLVSNSRVYRFTGSPRRADENIYVSVKPRAYGADVVVDDAARGMTSSEKEIAGKRSFPYDPYRGDQGAGMGLYIARKALGEFGEWTIEDSSRGGTVFTLQLRKG